MKLFTCFVEKENGSRVLATEFLFKKRHVIPEGSILAVSVAEGFPLPEPETIIPGFVEKLQPAEVVKTKNGKEKQLFHYCFDPAEFLFEFFGKFKMYEQKFTLFKKLLKESNFEKAKSIIADLENGNSFMFSIFYNNGYYEVYGNYLSEDLQTVLKHIKATHKNMLLYVEELTLNLNLY